MTNQIEPRLIQLCIDVIRTIEKLEKGNAQVILQKQLIRSMSSSVLNYGEARGAQSNRDFIHKLAICTKELMESRNNIKILVGCNYLNNCDSILDEMNQLIAMLIASRRTVEKKSA